MSIVIYLGISVTAGVIVFLGIPALTSSLALFFGYYGKHDPVLIGLFISIGAGIGSVFVQKTGQKFFDVKNKKCSKTKKRFIDSINKHQKIALPLILISSVSIIPESWILFTIGKDYSKKKIFVINLFTRWLNFYLIAYLGENYLQKIMNSVIHFLK